MTNVSRLDDEDDVLGDIRGMVTDALEVRDMRIRSTPGSIVCGSPSMKVSSSRTI
jgi:hypothetical protein